MKASLNCCLSNCDSSEVLLVSCGAVIFAEVVNFIGDISDVAVPVTGGSGNFIAKPGS